MPTKCYAQVRGSVIRATRVDACGVPLPGTSSVVVSKRISTISIDEQTDDGTNIRDRNFGDELCVVDDAYTSTIGYTADITLCGVDPDMISIFTGQPVVKDAAGDTIGFDAQTGLNLGDTAFALEVWSRIAGGACAANGYRQWGYTVFPFLKGGRLGAFSFENAAVQFQIQGAQTRDGNGWGAGPFNVTRGAGVKEVQTVTITGTPTGGTYTLTFGGQTTAAIPYNATATAVASALNALSAITAVGGVTATGGPHPGTPVVLTFGNMADVTQMTATSSLTGGTTPTVTVTTTTPGSAGVPSPLFTPLGANTHYRNIVVSLDPPAAACGATSLPAA